MKIERINEIKETLATLSDDEICLVLSAVQALFNERKSAKNILTESVSYQEYSQLFDDDVFDLEKIMQLSRKLGIGLR